MNENESDCPLKAKDSLGSLVFERRGVDRQGDDRLRIGRRRRHRLLLLLLFELDAKLLDLLLEIPDVVVDLGVRRRVDVHFGRFVARGKERGEALVSREFLLEEPFDAETTVRRWMIGGREAQAGPIAGRRGERDRRC